jgi:hypothetical protein
MYRRFAIAMLGAVVALAVVAAAQGAPAQQSAQDPAPPPISATYGKLSADWWQWALSLPVHSPPGSGTVSHPLVDLTGAQCGVGQRGPVWFLGGAFFQNGIPTTTSIVRDHCVVPHGKALFFPALNIECSALEGTAFGCAGTVEGLRAAVISVMDAADNLEASVDGTPLPVFRVNAATKPAWSFSLAADNILDFIGEGPFAAGRYRPAVDDGYYALVLPLPSGQHTIHFHGEVPAFSFILDVTYHLTVA